MIWGRRVSPPYGFLSSITHYVESIPTQSVAPNEALPKMAALSPKRTVRTVTVLRSCVRCGRPSRGSYCTKHKRKPWATSKRRERMGLSGGKWETLRQKVLRRDRTCCYLCDKLGADQVDHLVEVADGGTNDLTNLASCHKSCHDRKHRDPEWAEERVEKALAVLGART